MEKYGQKTWGRDNDGSTRVAFQVYMDVLTERRKRKR